MGDWYTIGLALGLGVALGVLLAGFLSATRLGRITAVVLGAAFLTSLLPAGVQEVIFRGPVLIVVLILGTGWLLWRISRPRPRA